MTRSDKKYFLLLQIVLVFFLHACNKDKITERDYPRIEIDDSVEQTDSSATFTGFFLTESEDIQDKGFVWVNGNYGSKLSCGPGFVEGDFKGTTTYDLKEGNDISVRAYIVSSDMTIYSRSVEFHCLSNGVKPAIREYGPHSARRGDTLSIWGSNFSHSGNNIRIYFGNALGLVISASDTLLKATVPAGLNEDQSVIKVVNYQDTVFASPEFQLLGP